MKKINFIDVQNEYNSLMFDLGLEHNSIGTDYSENTENWNLRDMVSECQYQYECYYEKGHIRAEGRYPNFWKYNIDDIFSESRYNYISKHNEEEQRLHDMWLNETKRLRNFIRKYRNYINELECYEGHCSYYD